MRSRKEAEELYSQNEKLVFGFLKIKHPELMFDEDVQQWCRIGLWLACLNYNADYDCKFSAYAYKSMNRQLVNNFFRPQCVKKNGGTGFATKYEEERAVVYSLDRRISDKDDAAEFYNFFSKSNELDWYDHEGIVKRLKPKDKQILQMRLAGFSTCEIGVMFKQTGANIRRRIEDNIKPVIKKELCLE